MNLQSFVERSEGQWRSMRSGHSLAFQQFEEVLSRITIERLDLNDERVIHLIESEPSLEGIPDCPFRMEWNAESDWEPDDPSEVSAGSCILVPVPSSETSGVLLRSVGYAEAEQASSKYEFLSDGTFVLSTKYG